MAAFPEKGGVEEEAGVERTADNEETFDRERSRREALECGGDTSREVICVSESAPRDGKRLDRSFGQGHQKNVFLEPDGRLDAVESARKVHRRERGPRRKKGGVEGEGRVKGIKKGWARVGPFSNCAVRRPKKGRPRFFFVLVRVGEYSHRGTRRTSHTRAFTPRYRGTTPPGRGTFEAPAKLCSARKSTTSTGSLCRRRKRLE